MKIDLYGSDNLQLSVVGYWEIDEVWIKIIGDGKSKRAYIDIPRQSINGFIEALKIEAAKMDMLDRLLEEEEGA